MRRLALVLLCALAGACSTVPFREAEPVSMEGIDPAALLSRFQEVQAERFRTMSSVLFEIAGRRVAALGITEVDRGQGTFTAAAMNPMGVKLFELSGGADGKTDGFLLEAIAQRGNAATAIGDDIRRIYFGLVPAPGASVERQRDRIVFREPSGTGMLAYVFAGVGGFIIEKRFTEDDETVWKVRYYEYRRIGGRAHPMGIVLDNYRRGYRLVIKVKEIAA